MSTTTNLKLFKHDNPTTNTDQFDIEKALNENWDKVDDNAGEIAEEIAELNKSTTTQATEIQKLKNENTSQAEKIQTLENQNTQQTTEIESLKSENTLLKSQIPSVTVTGQTIHIEDSSNMQCRITPLGASKQETREGYNKLKNTATTQTINGITFTKNEDGTVIANGTASANADFALSNIELESGSYTLNGAPSTSASNTYKLIAYDYADGFYSDVGSGVILMPTATQKYQIFIRVYSGQTLNNVVFRPMLIEGTEIKEYEQYGASPSIEYESPIESVGDNINLCNKDTIKSKYILNEDGTITTSIFNTFASDYIEVEENEDYAISGMPTLTSEFPLGGSTGNWRLAFYDTNKNFISLISKSNINEATFLTPANCKYVVFGNNSQFSSLEILNNYINNNQIKLSKGTSTGAYSPYGQGSVEIKQSAKNLANYTNNTTEKNFNIGDVKIGKTYSLYLNINGFISFNLRYGSSSGTLIFTKYSVSGKRVYTFTATENGVLYFNGFTSDAGAFVSVDEIMLIEGEYTIDTIPTYEKYQGKIKALYTQQPFRAIRDVKDRFVKIDEAYYERHPVKRLILDGTEEYTAEVSDGFSRFNIILNDALNIFERNENCKSNYFKTSTVNGHETIMLYQTRLMFYPPEDITTVEQFKALLAKKYEEGTPVYVDYILETPQLIPCTPEQVEVLESFNTYKNVTNISSDSMGELEVTYYCDLKTYIHNAINGQVGQAIGGEY